MLKIECPWCGPRPESEFHCGGESHIQRPAPYDKVTDKEWAEYLFYRIYPRGVEYERWLHRYGCGEWFNVARDTVTHEIKAVYAITEPKPDVEGNK